MESLTCAWCNRKCTTKSGLTRHQKSCQNKPGIQCFLCPVASCNLSYRVPQSLFLHINDHLENSDSIPESFFSTYNRYVCTSCCKNFTTSRRHECKSSSHCGPSSPASSSETNTIGHLSSNTTNIDSITSDVSSVPTSLQSVFESIRNVPVLERIPCGARTQIASALCLLLDEVCRDNSIDSWVKLLRFPAFCLHKSKRAGRNNRSLASIIKDRITNFFANPYQQISDSCQRSALRLKTPSNESFRTNLVKKKVEIGDIKGAIRIISSDEGLTPPSEAVFESLRSKHPPPHPESNLPPSPSVTELSKALRVDERQVMKAIHSFPSGSAGGPDLLKPQHLKDLMLKSVGEPSRHLLSSLTNLCNLLLSGKVLQDVIPSLYGASLLALTKPCGGIRPIAIGCVYRRLACKIAAAVVKSSSAPSILSPHQLGVGTSLGTESIIHATRAFCKKELVDSDTCHIIKVDFSNAFNCIRRDVVLKQFRDKVDFLFPFMWQMYGSHSNLFYEDVVISSTEGMQQGDPLGPLGFSLAINDLISSLSSPLNCWYLDDGCLGGPANLLQKDIDSIMQSQDRLGLSLNLSKCEIISPSNSPYPVSEEALRCMKRTGHNDATILGSPMFPEAFETVFNTKIVRLETLSSRLRHLDSHVAFTLLKNCISLPKVQHLLRSFPAFLFPDLLRKFDSVQKSSLETILNCSLSETNIRQAFLPVSKGGLGLRSTAQLSLPAYIASAYGVEGLVASLLPFQRRDIALDSALEQWRDCCPEEPFPEGEDKTLQRSWDKPVTDKILEDLISNADNVSKCRLLSASSTSAGVWLSALPIPSLGLKLSNEQMRICVALRLGSRICVPHQCICGATVHEDGIHGLSCRKNGGRAPRHAEANDVIKRALVSAGIPAIKEPQGISRQDGKRPDGATLLPWERGRPLLWDFTCTDPLAPSNIRVALQGASKMAAAAEDKKRTKYAHLQHDYAFVPVAAETLGAWGPEAFRFLKDLGRRIREATGELRASQYLFQRLSIAVQRGNAASVLSCVPTALPLNEVLYFS